MLYLLYILYPSWGNGLLVQDTRIFKKAVHVRFIPADSEGGNADPGKVRKKKVTNQSSTCTDFLSSSPRARSCPSKLMQCKEQLPGCTRSTYYPRGPSISDMIKLAKINNETATTIGKIFKFGVEMLYWFKVPTILEFYEEKEPTGTGGFRKAFKATSKPAEFVGTT